MTEEIRHAFAHPVERAAATTRTGGPLDRISLTDHVVEVEIGAFQAERGTLQRVRFNIVVEVEPFTAPVDDDVDRILSYDRVTEAIAFELDAERLNLLETLAERVAERILAEPRAARVFVRIEKLDRGPGALGVEIVREHGGEGAATELAEPPHPKVVFFADGANATAEMIEAQIGDKPVIFCAGMPEMARPASMVPMAQRRIDLLALDQSAWVLAGLDPRCVVVSTRTELDWSMKHGKISVWAPSKIFLDAVQTPDAGPSDPEGLARWFAEEMQAAEVVVLG